jgi:Family of unknown function (DUF6289)
MNMKNKRFSAMVLGLALMGATSAFAVARAPIFAWFQFYYSDATLGTQVGGIDVDCNGNVSTWGTVTRFRGPRTNVGDICPGVLDPGPVTVD